MNATHPVLRRFAATAAGAGLAALAGLAAADQIIVLEGTSEVKDGPQPLGERLKPEVRYALCNAEFDKSGFKSDLKDSDAYQRGAAYASDFDRAALEQLGQVDHSLAEQYEKLGNQAADRLADEAEDKRSEACNPKKEPGGGDFQIIYSTCRMTMRTRDSMIDVRFPPNQDGGWLTFMDPRTLQAIEINPKFKGVKNYQFTSILNILQDADPTDDSDVKRANGKTPAGNPSSQAAPPQQLEIRRNFVNSITLTGREYRFRFQFELDVMKSIMATQMLGVTAAKAGVAGPEIEAQVNDNLANASSSPLPEDYVAWVTTMQTLTPEVTTSGTATIAESAPGLEIIRTFYQKFADAMGAEGSYMSGLYNHVLLEKGMPIHLKQTSTITMAHIALPIGMPTQQSESETWINHIIGPLTTDQPYCDNSIVPDDYTVTNPAELAGQAVTDAGTGGAAAASSAATASSSAGTGADLGALLGGLSGAAAATGAGASAGGQMTPEQQAQLMQATAALGQLFGNAAGAAASAANTANTADTASARVVPAPASPTATRSGSSLSAALMTDDLTQSAQNMLEALGYDPGETDGELSVETTIAISQFQAEKGLEVTGEVTPQLVGMLAAEVDAL